MTAGVLRPGCSMRCGAGCAARKECPATNPSAALYRAAPDAKTKFHLRGIYIRYTVSKWYQDEERAGADIIPIIQAWRRTSAWLRTATINRGCANSVSTSLIFIVILGVPPDIACDIHDFDATREY